MAALTCRLFPPAVLAAADECYDFELIAIVQDMLRVLAARYKLQIHLNSHVSGDHL